MCQKVQLALAKAQLSMHRAKLRPWSRVGFRSSPSLYHPACFNLHSYRSSVHLKFAFLSCALWSLLLQFSTPWQPAPLSAAVCPSEREESGLPQVPIKTPPWPLRTLKLPFMPSHVTLCSQRILAGLGPTLPQMVTIKDVTCACPPHTHTHSLLSADLSHSSPLS